MFILKKVAIIITLLFLFFAGSGCDTGKNSGKEKASFASISVEKARQLIKNKENLMVIDVRSPQELKQGKIPGSILIPFWTILKGDYTIPKNRPLLLVCAVGGRSYAVGQYLAKKGYSEVYNMSGGMNAWKKARYRVAY